MTDDCRLEKMSNQQNKFTERKLTTRELENLLTFASLKVTNGKLHSLIHLVRVLRLNPTNSVIDSFPVKTQSEKFNSLQSGNNFIRTAIYNPK